MLHTKEANGQNHQSLFVFLDNASPCLKKLSPIPSPGVQFQLRLASSLQGSEPSGGKLRMLVNFVLIGVNIPELLDLMHQSLNNSTKQDLLSLP